MAFYSFFLKRLEPRTDVAQQRVTNLVQSKVKNVRALKSYLGKENLGNFTLNQVRNMKKAADKLDDTTTYGQLYAFLSRFMTIPRDDEEMFVAGVHLDTENDTIRFVLTTKTCLRNIKHFALVQCDGTFKTTYLDTPLIVLGKNLLFNFFIVIQLYFCII